MNARASGGHRPRRFEFREGGAAKFWEIVREDECYTVTFGRIGTPGQSRTRELDDDEEAMAAVAKLIAEKLAKGYVEVGGIPPVAGSDWTRTESWRALRDAIQVFPARWGEPALIPTDEQMDVFEAAQDFRLPPSYRAFLKVFGPGDVTMFQIAAPGGPEHYSLEDLAEQARRRIEVEAIDFASDEYVGLEPVTRMVVFCSWDSDRWGWDRAERGGDGEYAIRRWYRSHPVAEKVADTFPEFLIEKLLLNGMFRLDAPDDPSFTPAIIREEKQEEHPAGQPKAAPKKSQPSRPKKRSAEEENAFLHRIASDPTDRETQVAYAEWLDQHRDPIADVIRARLDGKPDRELTEKERFLDLGLLPWALARLGARIRLDGDGRIAHIDIKGYQVNAGALREFASYPALRELELNDHQLTADELNALGDLTSLRELHLHDAGPNDEGFGPLARLSGLETLCLLRPSSAGHGLARLIILPRLETLILDVAPDRAEAHLAALAHWPALKALFLSRSELPGHALATVGRLNRIERLGLDGNPLRDGDLVHLAGLEGLRWLDLEGTGITGAALEHLKGLRSLETLKTTELPDADEGTRWIAGLTGLGELAMPGSYERRSLTDDGVTRLAALTKMRSLNLRCQQITDAGLAHLAGLAELEELDLSENRGITGPGLEHLKGLPKLRRLKLDSTGLTDAAVPLLKDFTGLEELGLWGTRIGERKLASLHKTLPGTKL